MNSEKEKLDAIHKLLRICDSILESEHFEYECDTTLGPRETQTVLSVRTWPAHRPADASPKPPPSFVTVALTDAEIKKLRREFEILYDGKCSVDLLPEPPITITDPFSVNSLDRGELLKLRDEINARLYDRERQPAM